MMKQYKQRIKQWWREEDGIGTLEVILIVAVIVIIAVAFRTWIIDWVENLFDSSNTELQKTKDTPTITPPSPNAP